MAVHHYVTNLNVDATSLDFENQSSAPIPNATRDGVRVPIEWIGGFETADELVSIPGPSEGRSRQKKKSQYYRKSRFHLFTPPQLRTRIER